MRYYDLEITNQEGKAILDRDGKAIGPYRTLSGNGDAVKVNPAGGLNIIFDIFTTALDVANGGTVLSVYGLPASVLSQEVSLFMAKVTLFGGFSCGLPLEKAEQRGIILQGDVWNAYGNWQGVNQSLNLIVNPGLLVQDDGKPLNIVIDGKEGEKISEVLRRGLSSVYKNHTLDINISDDLILPEPWKTSYPRPGILASFLRSSSVALLKNDLYNGISMIIDKGIIRLYDNLTMSGATEIASDELIGQPTWIEQAVVSFKTPLRGDLLCGDNVILPAWLTNGAGSLLSVNTSESYSWGRRKINFSGTFQIRSLRHVGDYRNPAGEAWVTIIEAIMLGGQT